MTGHNPDQPAWLDRHPAAVDIAANWVGLTLLLAWAVTLAADQLGRHHNTTAPSFWLVLATIAAARAGLEGVAPWAWRQTIGRRTTP